jgi:hypothetical protein
MLFHAGVVGTEDAISGEPANMASISLVIGIVAVCTVAALFCSEPVYLVVSNGVTFLMNYFVMTPFNR